MEAKVQINALVPRQLHDSLQIAAERNQNSMAAEVRRALSAHLVSEKRARTAGSPDHEAGIVDGPVAARTTKEASA
jgi:plasmid stability protein